jgi:hypothetical protein
MIGGCYGAFGGYLPAEAASEIYGSDRWVVSGGAFRPFGEAVVVILHRMWIDSTTYRWSEAQLMATQA